MDDKDGPKPMVDFKEADKRKNCKELFLEENDTNYTENIEKQEKIQLENVKKHNLGFPRLSEELHKKKSVTQVTTLKTINIIEEEVDLPDDFDPECKECLKLAAFNIIKKWNPRKRCNIPANKQLYKQHGIRHTFSTKIHKPSKTHRRVGISRNNKSCQCVKFLQIDNVTSCDSDSNAYLLKDNSVYEMLYRNGNKPHPSMSSFNSYGPHTQEPMED